MVKKLLVFILPCIFLATLTPAQAEETDVGRMGLKGRVMSLTVRTASFKEYNGDWVELPSTQVQETEFNAQGQKTDETTVSPAGVETRRTRYVYDDSGALTERKTFGYGNLTESWSKAIDEDGYETLFSRYDAEGAATSRSLQRFTAGGRKLAQIDYDAEGEVTSRWESTDTADGREITYGQSNEWRFDEVTLFDVEGRIAAKEKSTRNIQHRWEYLRQPSGRLEEGRYTETRSTTADLPPHLYALTYDRQGRLEEVTHSVYDGVILSTRRYTYYPAADPELVRTETAEWYGPGGDPLKTWDHLYTWVYEYDSKGNLSEKTYVHAQEPFSCRWTFRYDSAGRTIEEVFRDSSDRIFSTTENVYDRKGNKITEELRGRGVASGHRKALEYDSEGRLLDTSVYDLEGRRLSRETRRYDARGSILESSQHNSDDSLRTRTRYEYVYDDAGNWIEKKTLSTNNAEEQYDTPTSVARRTIAYFE